MRDYNSNLARHLVHWIPIVLLAVGCVGSSKIRGDKTASHTFSKQQIELIMSADSLTPMRVFKINNQEDSILLRSKSQDVNIDPTDPVLQRFVKRLHRTVQDSMSMGVGIAAPQVGILKNIIWIQRFDKDNFPFEGYLNPKIIKYSELKQDCLEGCLSIPNRRDTTRTRSKSIELEYNKMDASHRVENVEGFTAVIFQHEIDHLNGILYLDHLDEEVRNSSK